MLAIDPALDYTPGACQIVFRKSQEKFKDSADDEKVLEVSYPLFYCHLLSCLGGEVCDAVASLSQSTNDHYSRSGMMSFIYDFFSRGVSGNP